MYETISCPHCGCRSSDEVWECARCGKSLLIAALECTAPFAGMAKGASVELLPKNYNIGRDDDNDIVIDDPYVSRRHVELTFNPKEKCFYVRDVGTNREEYELENYKIADGGIIPLGQGAFRFKMIAGK